MNEIEQFIGSSKKVTIDGKELEIYSINYEDLAKISNPEGQQEILKGSLKKTFPDATEDQIKKLKLGFITEYIKHLYEVSGMKIDEKKLGEMRATFSA